MVPISKTTSIWKYSSHPQDMTVETQDVITEQSVGLVVNHEHWLTFICSPMDLDALALGFLWDEGVIDNLDEVEAISIKPDYSTIDIILKKSVIKPRTWHRTSTGFALASGKNQLSFDNDFSISADLLIKLFGSFSSKQTLHKSIGGYHSAALSDGEVVNISVEDVGRHNCLDKVSGLYLLGQKAFIPQLVFLTGRISSEMIHKALKLNVSFIVSRTTPTINAFDIAIAHGITLIGYLRGNSFIIYSHPEKVLY